MKKTAVVILNWNGHKLLEQFLPSVMRYTALDNVEVVVADNSSTDDSIAFLRNEYPQVKQVCLAENYGYAEGYNRALKEVDAEYFVLLNSDVEVTEKWLEPMIAYLDEHAEVAAVQPKLLAQRNKALFEYAGAAGGFIDKYGYPFCRGRIFSEVEEDCGQYNDPIDILWASGACLMIRSKDFFDAGGFDGSFFAHMEEIDLCWRLNSRGKRLVYLPDSVIYHVGGGTLSEDSPHKTFLNFRNNLLMLYKNLPDESLNKVMKIRLVLDYLAAFEFALTGKFLSAKAVFRAHKEFEKIKASYLLVRENNLEKTVQHTLKTIYSKSILVDFYFRGARHFSKLRNFN